MVVVDIKIIVQFREEIHKGMIYVCIHDTGGGGTPLNTYRLFNKDVMSRINLIFIFRMHIIKHVSFCSVFTLKYF